MKQPKTNEVDKLKRQLLELLDHQDSLAYLMFQEDHPQATVEEFQNSDERPRYSRYALVALTSLMPSR